MADTPQRAAVYCRLSYAPDGSVEKVDRQEADCRDLAMRLGWDVSEAHVFKDNSRSAWQRNRKRPGWDAMLNAVEAGEVDGILCYHGDRLMRQPHDLEKLIAAAESRGMRIASVSGQRDLDSPDDRFILRIEVAQACRESDNTSRRTRRGLAARMARGLSQVGGHRPFGYGVVTGYRERTDPESGQKVKVPIYDTTRQVPEEAAYGAEAIERLLSGQTQASVVKWLASKCKTTEGGEWTTKTFHDWAISPRVAGLIEHAGSFVEAAWEGIVSVETWEQVKGLYARNSELHPYPGRARKYMLSLVAECGECGALVRGRPVSPGRKRNRAKSTQYYCRECGRVTRKTEYVDEYVSAKVVKLLNNRRFLAEFETLRRAQDPGLAAQIADLELRRSEAKETLENLADNPEVDAALVARSLASFGRRIAELRNQLASETSLEVVSRLVGITPEGWERTPVDIQATAVKTLLHVTLVKTARRGPGFDPESVVVERRPLLSAEAHAQAREAAGADARAGG